MKMYLPAVLLLCALVASTNGQVLRVELDEADYSADNDHRFLTGRVTTSSTQTQEPTQIQLLPLTIAEYNEIFLVGPCNIPNDARPADSSDIDETPIVIEIPANPLHNNLKIEFQVPLLPSMAVEAEETFLLLLNATNSDVEVGNQACAIVKLGASDPPSEVIRLERTTVEVAETSGFNHLFNVNVIETVKLEVAITLMLSVSGLLTQALARPGEDFTLPTMTLRIELGESLAQVNVNITDDSIAEDDEAFSIRVTANLDGIKFEQTEQAEVTIKDDEVVGFGLVEEETNVFEGEDAEVCVEYHNTTDVPFDRIFNSVAIQLTTSDGTAKGGVDYITATNTYRLLYNPMSCCFRFQTIANDLQQPTRYFTVNLDTSFASDVTKITPSSTRINIIDDDGKLRSFITSLACMK